MTNRPRVLCAGHSHLSAPLRAHIDNYRTGEWNFDFDFLRLQAEMYQPNFLETDGVEKDAEREMNPLILRHMRHKTITMETDAVLCLFNGNEINAMALLRHKTVFDFTMPGDNDPLDPTAEIVPYGALRDMISYRIEEKVMQFVTAMREIYPGEIFVAPPPPPIPSERHILSYPGGFKALASKRGVAPAPLRRKMWRLYVDVLTQKVEAAGAKMLSIPPAAFDDDGYFKSDYWHTDPTHGNFEYGDLLIRHTLSEVFSITPERNAA